MIHTRRVPDAQEEITPGAAMAGMILNGVGVANRPVSLPPQCFAHTPLDLLCREGIRAEMFHRFPLGRTLDEVYAYGGDLLCSECAVAVCVQEGIALRFQPLDTTSVSLSGDDMPDSDAQAIPIPHGDSKDHRPDLQQAVLGIVKLTSPPTQPLLAVAYSPWDIPPTTNLDRADTRHDDTPFDSSLQTASFSSGDHQPLCLALLPLQPELPGCPGDDGGTRRHRVARSGALLGTEIRPGVCQSASQKTTAARGQVAHGRGVSDNPWGPL